MSRFEALLLHLSTALVGGTGLVYAWMVYLVRPADPYAVVNHPWQPHLQHFHVLVAPLLVFGAGLIWRRHVWACWKLGIRQSHRSGVALALSLVPMVASGYLIQTAVEPGWRKAWVVVHLAASGLWLLGYLIHGIQAWRVRVAQGEAPGRIPLGSDLPDPAERRQAARAIWLRR